MTYASSSISKEYATSFLRLSSSFGVVSSLDISLDGAIMVDHE